ncbi:hypothetical protein Nepgr_024063 [Nepenthes gracilis]|uniref:CASP-like protein n=1 Tax=Nepenthes gracilis TaxID=150966 RepID=A0AAD3T2H2_NEPGR|nr:hypothetical protein Nepgr_024063 [Nepenthes gracilis]
MRQMMNGEKKLGEVGIQLPVTKGTAASPAVETGTMSGPLESSFGTSDQKGRTSIDAIHAVLRLLCLFSSVIALSLMITAKEDSTISLYGFQLPVFSKWTFSDSFECLFDVVSVAEYDECLLSRYLVGVSAAVVAHSLLQLLIDLLKLWRKAPVISSRNYAWLIFAGDQVKWLKI